MIFRLSRVTVCALALAALAACTRSAPVDMGAVRAEVGANPVVLLSASWCGYCRKVRADLNHWGVPFDEFDVEDSRHGSRAYALLRGSGVPILLIKDRPVHGYMPQRAHQLLVAARVLPVGSAH